MDKSLYSILSFFLAFPVFAETLTLSVNSTGVAIESDAGKYVLSAPNLILKEDDYSGIKPQLSLKDADTLIAKYPDNDLEIAIKVDAGSKMVSYSLSPIPQARSLRFSMLVPLKLNAQGTKFSFDDAPYRVFPIEKKDQLLFSGGAKQFRIINSSENGFAIIAPASWQGLQDNRLFNWDTFEYQFLYDFISHPQDSHFIIAFEPITASR